VLEARHLAPALAASLAAHVLLGIVLLGQPPPSMTPVRVIPVSLVGALGGDPGEPSGAGPGPAAVDQPTPVPVPEPSAAPPVPKAPRRTAPVVPRRDVAPPEGARSGAAAATSEVAGGGGDGAAGGGGGSGDGVGGGGGVAGAAYGSNPLPPYPIVARRLGMEGRVELEVQVAADGRATAVRILRSSGFGPLDAAAVTTVRDRWRFIPARQGGTPVESRVTVPIVFRLDGSSS
jgi:protein TonB